MNITGINKARLFLFIFFAGVFLIFHSVILINQIPEYNNFLLGGLILFFISMAAILEKLVVDIIFKTIHDKNKSNIHMYLSTKALSIAGISLIAYLVIIVLLSIYFYLEEKSVTWVIMLFGSSLSLLNVSFLLDTGRLVFINNEYIIYHQGLYKKVVAYQYADASVIFIVVDGKKRQKTAAIKFKNLETRSKVIEDFVKNGLKEECE